MLCFKLLVLFYLSSGDGYPMHLTELDRYIPSFEPIFKHISSNPNP